MVNEIKRIALLAGADLVIYDTSEMQNILADATNIGKVVCLLDEVNTIKQTIKANGVKETYPIVVTFAKQAYFQNTAENNAATMNAMLTCARSFLMNISRSEYFGKLIESTTTKFTEDNTDANLMGWKMSIEIELIDGYTEC
jgi:hypothetical protein